MSLFGVLTIVFAVLKLLGIISWGWLYVLMPELIEIGIRVVFSIIGFVMAHNKIS